MEMTNNPPPGYEHWKRKAAWFLSGQAVSLFGSSLTQFAIVWHITLSTTSGVMLMISTLCSFLPQILISLFAGVWADRHNRKYLIMIADGSIALVTLILAMIFRAGYQELWLLFLVSAIRSVGTGVQSPAVNALIPQIVPQDKLMRINGVNGTIQSLTMLASPAVSGVVLSLLGLEAAFFIDVITAIIAIVIMLQLKVPRMERPEGHADLGALQDLKNGLLYTWRYPFLRSFFGFYAALMFLVTPAAILSPLLIARSFGEEVWRLTANEMAWSLGMVVGGMLIAAWGGFHNKIHTLALGTILFGLFTFAMGIVPNFTAFLVILFITGVTMSLINSPGMVILQESVDAQMQGRVFGLVQIVSSVAIPLGMAIFGPIADMIPVEWLMISTGLLMAALGPLLLKSRNIRQGYTVQ